MIPRASLCSQVEQSRAEEGNETGRSFPCHRHEKVWFHTLNLPSSGSQILVSHLTMPTALGYGSQCGLMRRNLSRKRLKESSGSRWTLTITRFFCPDCMFTMWSRPWRIIMCYSSILRQKVLMDASGRSSCILVARNERTKQPESRSQHLTSLEKLILPVYLLETDDVVDVLLCLEWLKSIASPTRVRVSWKVVQDDRHWNLLMKRKGTVVHILEVEQLSTQGTWATFG